MEMKSLNSILLVSGCWHLSVFPAGSLWHGFYSCGPLLIFLSVFLCSWCGLISSSSLGPPQGRTLQTKTSILELSKGEAARLLHFELIGALSLFQRPHSLPLPNWSISIPNCPLVSFELFSSSRWLSSHFLSFSFLQCLDWDLTIKWLPSKVSQNRIAYLWSHWNLSHSYWKRLQTYNVTTEVRNTLG